MRRGGGGRDSHRHRSPLSEKPTIEFVVSPYGTAHASGNVMKLVMEEAGYDVKLTNADVGLCFQGIASGSVDVYLDGWLPTTQGPYYDKFKDEMNWVRINLDNGTRCGLVVPEYVTIDSITDMNGVKEKFDSEIVGIEPGSGIMQQTETAIEEYDLDYTLQAGSEVAMLGALKSAIPDEDWTVVTGWSPHWKFMKWDLKYLDDPKGVYGGAEDIVTFTRMGFEDEYPRANGIVERFHWQPEDMETVMYYADQVEDMTGEDAAAKWIEDNREKVDEWLGPFAETA
ncbi:MAG: glycine betaine ABC transporter substrate-binding protein [Methanomicrobiales archaeon]